MDCCGDQSSEKEEQSSMMPSMAKKMMSKMKGTDFNPQEMCEKMMSSVESTAKLAGAANSEVQLLFEEWVSEVEKEILEILDNQDEVDLSEVANELKISQDSVRYFISKLIREEKVKITDLEVL
ncbi:MAG: winged helix-turn-helix transcriptional regulator [Halanaerobacter sp.]